MELLYGFDKEVALFVGKMIFPNEKTMSDVFSPSVAIGVINNKGGIVAGVVYHDYTEIDGGGNMQMSIASTNPWWLTKKRLGGIFHYPFVQANCHRVTALVNSRNARSLKLAKGLGFKQEGVMRDYYIDDDAIILGLLRKDCGFIDQGLFTNNSTSNNIIRDAK